MPRGQAGTLVLKENCGSHSRAYILAHEVTRAHTGTHIHAQSHACTRAHQWLPLLPSPVLSSPLLPRERGRAGQAVGAGPGQSPIAQCQDRSGSQRSGTRLSEPAGPRNPASVGHGLIIFLEKLGFCQVPLLQILPHPVGSCPPRSSAPPFTGPLGALQNHRGHHRSSVTLWPHTGCPAGQADSPRPPSTLCPSNSDPAFWEALHHTPPSISQLLFSCCRLCLFLCARARSD